MANILYNYPLSSCSCYNCEQKLYPSSYGHPTNMSVRDCHVPQYFDCYNREQFKTQQLPIRKEGFTTFNPDSMRISGRFEAVKCDKPNATCQGTTYLASRDPRLFDAPRAEYLRLDRPPTTGYVKLDTLTTDESLDGYGQNYRGYHDTKGQIVYYTDKSIEDVFYEPVFTIPSEVSGTNFQDPMSNIKPEYARIPIFSHNPLKGQYEPKIGGLSWIQDSCEHREDLMSRQMQTINQQRYTPRWSNLDD